MNYKFCCYCTATDYCNTNCGDLQHEVVSSEAGVSKPIRSTPKLREAERGSVKRKKNSEGIASEPYTSRGDDASGTFCSMENNLSANLCCNNRWRYTGYHDFEADMQIFKRTVAEVKPSPTLAFFLLLLFLFIHFKSHANEASFSTGQLPNGLTYYIHYDPYSKHHTSLDFIVKAGSLDEQEDERGFSHLIEHDILHKIQFKGKKLTDLRCEIWDYTIPNLGGVTSYDFTQYHFEISLGLPRGLEDGLLGLSSALSQFCLDKHDLEEMKEELLQELDENQLSPVESWKQWRIEQEYPPYRNKHPLGNPESISEASLEKIHQFYRQKYQTHRMAVIVIGNVDLEKTKQLLEATLGTLSTPYENEPPRPHSEPCLGRTGVYINKRLKNTLISLTKPLPKMSQRDFLAFSIMTRVVSQHLQTYAATPQAVFSQPILETLTYPGMLRLTVSLIEHFEGDQLREALESCIDQPVTEDQLNQIKAEILSSLKLIREKGNDPLLIDFYRDHFILKTSSLSTDHPALRTDLLETIHTENINQMLQTFQGFSKASLCSNTAYISPNLLSKQLLKMTDDRRNSDDN